MPASSADAVQRAAEYIRDGQPHLAQPLLADYLRQQPDADEAWYLLSFTVSDPKQQIDCLQRVLRHNPAHKPAQSRLVEVMTGRPAEVKPMTSVEWGAAMGTMRQDAARLDEITRQDEAKQQAAADQREVKPTASPIVQPSVSEFAELRKKMSSPKAVRAQRKSSKLRGILLALIVLVAAAGAATWYVLNQRPAAPAVLNEDPATSPAAAAPPTDTPAPTKPPTITPTRFPPTWTPTPSATPFPTRTPTPLPLIDPARDAELRTVQQQLAGLRGLPAASLIARYIAPADQVRAAAASVLNGAGLLKNLTERARTLSTLGLTRPTYTLEKSVFNSLLDTTGSFYSPWTLEMYVSANRAKGVEHYSFVLAAAYAMIDQAYEFVNTGAYPQCALDTQHCQAIRALITGDALLAQEQWLRQATSANDRQAVEVYRAPDLPVADDLAPLAIRRDINFGREAGRTFGQYLYQRGGWPRINRAYDELPLSTEQILHPEKYLAREAPITTTLPPLTDTLGTSWRLIADDVLGEWTTYLILSANPDELLRIPDNVAQAAARGWGGDRLQAYYNDDANATTLAVAWLWDTVADAREFQGALVAYLDLRFRGARIDQSGADCWQANDQVACIFTRDQNLLWLVLPDRALIDPVRAAYGDFP